jgi:uncharacterized membrane protein
MDKRIVFDATIEPNPPLATRHMFLVVLAIAAMSFIAGVAFVLRGAWPVTPFFGADVLLLYWAFVLVRERSRNKERIVITHEKVTVERKAVGRPAVRAELNPYWLRVEHDDPERMGAELALVSHGKRLVVGSYLGADERAALAEALRAAIREAKSPDLSANPEPA